MTLISTDILLSTKGNFHLCSQVSVNEAKETVKRWYNDRQEVRKWQEERKKEARDKHRVHTLLGRARLFPNIDGVTPSHKGHIERAAINTPVQVLLDQSLKCSLSLSLF